MVGYENERYNDFGWAAAKLDDFLNFLPARLGGVIAVIGGGIAGFDWKRAIKIFLRDRKKHKSPNSAHGESAFAGLLGISLGGGAYYDGEFEARQVLGDGLRDPVHDDHSYGISRGFACAVVCQCNRVERRRREQRPYGACRYCDKCGPVGRCHFS